MWRKEIGSEPSHDAGCLFDLSQNPAFRKMWSGVNRQIPTCAMQETFCGHLNMGDGFWPRNWHWPWASQSTRSLQKQHNVSRMLLDIFWSVVCFFESPSFWKAWFEMVEHHCFCSITFFIPWRPVVVFAKVGIFLGSCSKMRWFPLLWSDPATWEMQFMLSKLGCCSWHC